MLFERTRGGCQDIPKWSNTQKEKRKTDSQRAKIFTKIGREISVAVKEAGPWTPIAMEN